MQIRVKFPLQIIYCKCTSFFCSLTLTYVKHYVTQFVISIYTGSHLMDFDIRQLFQPLNVFLPVYAIKDKKCWALICHPVVLYMCVTIFTHQHMRAEHKSLTKPQFPPVVFHHLGCSLATAASAAVATSFC